MSLLIILIRILIQFIIVFFNLESMCGRDGSVLLGVFVLFVSFGSGLLELEDIVRGNEKRLEFFHWLDLDMLGLTFSIRLDSLGVFMGLLVLVVTLIVILYSIEYMGEDKSRTRYMGYVGVFSGIMLLLVMGNNMLVMILGYEGVGLLSYLLISIWSESLENSKSSVQAVLVNRVGDLIMLLGICVIYTGERVLDITLMNSLLEVDDKVFYGSIFIALGTISKSAQIGLHAWLRNAMSARTPISALLHAATMVTAGVYVVLRLSGLINSLLELKSLIVFLGSVTLVVTGSIGLVQTDMKKVVAYSTGSQLGYMILGCGMSAYGVVIFHLISHGMIKGLLILSAGLVIHSFKDEQDLRRVSGALSVLRVSYVGVVLGVIALVGLPYLSGIYSKEGIIEVSYVNGLIGDNLSRLGYVSSVFGVILTGFYSMRLLRLVIIGKPRGQREVFEKVEELGNFMICSVFVIGVISVIVGYLFKDALVGRGCNLLSGRVSGGFGGLDGDIIGWLIRLIPVIVSVLGLLFGFISFNFIRLLEEIFIEKWIMDKVFNENLIQRFIAYGVYTIVYIDKGFIEGFGGEGVFNCLHYFGKSLRNAHTGDVYNYIVVGLGVSFWLVLLLR